MILLDTNVLIYASLPNSEFHGWVISTISDSVTGDGCVGDSDPSTVPDRLRHGGAEPPNTPLPDFFVGAHALERGWDLATADPQWFRSYFPGVRLITP